MRLADSNILLYAVSADPAEAGKRARAIEVLADRDNLALSVQVLAEFYHQATRRSRPDMLSHDEAMRFIGRLAALPVQPVTAEVFQRATELCNRFGISYWDAAILAAAGIIGCEAVYSEDLSEWQDYAGIRVINPFSQEPGGRPAPANRTKAP